MKNKMLLLVGTGIGYLLGTRAGREKYDQIVDQAQKLWGDPRVQDAVTTARSSADSAFVQAQDQVKGKVKDRLEVPLDITAQELESRALASEAVQRSIGDAPVRKVIVKEPKLVNIVI